MAVASGEDLTAFARAAARDELTDYTVYNRLSEASIGHPRLQEVLSRLAATERGHYEFWRARAGGQLARMNGLKLRLILFLRFLFGTTFVVKFLERGERGAIQRYEAMVESVAEADRPVLRRIIADEREHEQALMGQIEDRRVKYISFIVLGLADAVVEVAGIHAGSLGIYDVTRLAGLAGIVAGAAASIAMASAAYAQAKQGFQGSAGLSAVYTGVSYFLTAAVLATPYFFTEDMVYAMFTSLVAGVLLVSFIAYYSAVISGTNFRKDFAEITAIMLGATAALYLLGTFIRYALGITI